MVKLEYLFTVEDVLTTRWPIASTLSARRQLEDLWAILSIYVQNLMTGYIMFNHDINWDCTNKIKIDNS
jgi:hypothetical protein